MIKGQQPIHREIAVRMREAISSGEWEEGAFVPAERELCSAFEVSRPTVRAALELLEGEGLVIRRHGRRPVVADNSGPVETANRIGVVTGIRFSEVLAATQDDRSKSLAGVFSVLEDNNYNVTYINAWQAKGRNFHIDFTQSECDGVIYAPLSDFVSRPIVRALQQTTLPVVVIGEEKFLIREDAHWVWLDEFEGARQATTHLIEAGHRDLLYLAFEEPFPWTEVRMRAFRKACMDAGGVNARVLRLPFGLEEIYGDGAIEGGRYLRDNLPETVTGVFAANDMAAYCVYRYTELVGKAVPAELSIVGFDNFRGAEEMGLTTVSFMSENMGRRGAEIMLEAIRNSGANEVHRECIVPKLIVRQSVSNRGEKV